MAGGYFIGFSIMQIPVGLLLDKIGPKKVIGCFLMIALIGTISFAIAKSFTGLFISRIFIGVGVSACMMGPLTGYRVWFAEKYQQRANSWMLMVANIGFVSSTLPVQILLPYIGWRSIFILIAILILLSIILIFLFIPNWDRKENTPIKYEKESLSQIWKNKFFISMIPLAFINYGGIQAIQTLWAGPWMLNISGYTPLQSATGLFWINITMLISYFIWGYILPKISDYGINSIKLIKLGLPISYFSLFLIISALCLIKSGSNVLYGSTFIPYSASIIIGALFDLIVLKNFGVFFISIFNSLIDIFNKGSTSTLRSIACPHW